MGRMKNKGLREGAACTLLKSLLIGAYVEVKHGSPCVITHINWGNGEVRVALANTGEAVVEFIVMHYDIEVKPVHVGNAKLTIFDRDSFEKCKFNLAGGPVLPHDGNDEDWAKALVLHAHNEELPLTEFGLRLEMQR